MASRPNNSSGDDEAFGDKMKRMTQNCLQSTGLCCFKAGENAQIKVLESKMGARQKKFGTDYMTLVKEKAPQSQLDKCLRDAINDVDDIDAEIDEHHGKIDDKTDEVQRSIKNSPTASSAAAPAPNKKMTGRVKKEPNNSASNKGNGNKSSNSNKPGSKNNNQNPAVSNVSKNNASKKKPPAANVAPSGGGKSKKGADAHVPEEYKDADPSKWKFPEYKFSGQATFEEKGYEEKVKGTSLPISKGLQKVKSNPGKYVAIAYQSEMTGWPDKDQQYMIMHRKGTIDWKPIGVSPKGWMTVHVNEYERLKPFKDDILPKKFRDKYTDNMSFNGRKLHSAKNKPIMPGRGMGSGDLPNLKIIGDVDPSDIFQGSVGDCWLLSGISSVAEFDGAIKRLFRKTPNLMNMPMDANNGTVAAGNMYTVTLWDLATWKEVDIVVDERLPAHYDGTGKLLANKPSEDGELWACYLEKALAIHSGGWDKIVGGQCTHAWALLTGCKEQYTMMRNPANGKWRCFGKFNPQTNQWGKHANSPHDCPNTTWRIAWPEVGGGGGRDKELDDEELFLRLYAWDQVNYIVGAGTKGDSDKKSTGGLVDNHAYSVIESVDNVAGTDIDLIKVRNPWGKGEIEDGEFDDDGPGWDKYPQIKKALNPVVADDGIFWVTKKEFFVFFQTIYLSASNMTEFLED